MPQLDPTFFLTQVVWLAITFILVYLLIWRVAMPRISGVLQERQDRIEGDIEKSDSLKKDAEDVLAAYEKAMSDGRAEAQTAIRAATEEIAGNTERRHQELSDRLGKEAAAAEERINKAKQAALDNIREIASETAVAAAGKLTGRDISAEDAAAAVGDVLAERN